MSLQFERVSLVGQVAQTLRGELAGGVWREWLPTERALCEQLRVSRRTLRAALIILKNEGLISSHVGLGNRVRGRAAAAKGRRSAAAPSVGLVMPEPIDVLRPYLTLWIDRLKSELFEAGVALRVHTGRHYFRPGGAGALRKLVAQHRHEAWVLALSTKAMQRWFDASGLHAIVAGVREPSVALPSVFVDSGALGRHACGRLLALGHRRLVLFSAADPSPGALAMEQAFRAALAEHPDARGDITRLPDAVAETRRAVDRLLRAKPRVTGILCLNPLAGVTVITTLMDRGLRLPRDMSVVTTFGDPFMQFLSPEPTRYKYDPAVYARKIARMALHLVHAEPLSVQLAPIVPTFVPGETLAAPAERSQEDTKGPAL